MLIFMKIRPGATQLFHADRQTDGRRDINKLIADFRDFAIAPKSTGKTTYLITFNRSIHLTFVKKCVQIPFLISTSSISW
jgi:hypothetical protein